MEKRIAVVTGGTGAIGLAISLRLARAGNTVISTCLEIERASADEYRALFAEQELSGDVVFADISSWEDCERAVRETEQRHGPIDILVNCAGITADSFLHKMDRATWDAVINVNLNGVFNMTRNVIEGMRERGYGRIVNISSMNGQTGHFGQCNYSASKAAVHGFTMALAKEAARKGITVNTVSPGYVDSQLTRKIPEDIKAAAVAQIPAGRMGDPDEIAAVAAFLASPDASYVTGANVPVNGGAFVSF